MLYRLLMILFRVQRRLYEAFLNKDPVRSQTGALKGSSLEASTVFMY